MYNHEGLKKIHLNKKKMLAMLEEKLFSKH